MRVISKEETIVTIDAGEGVALEGALSVPPDAGGVVLFAHGSGSSRLSPRNNYVASELRKAGLGTLLKPDVDVGWAQPAIYMVNR